LMTVVPALALGIALGVRHATDADHVAAVSTIVTESRSATRAAFIGLWWGVGHSASVLLVGGVLVLLRLSMPTRFALSLEFLAALMLIVLGIRSLFRQRPTATSGASTSLRPAAIGVIHGLAGSAVLALLILSATDSVAAAAAYLVTFCFGTVIGMGLITALLTVPARLGSVYFASFDRGMRVAAGLASLVVGLLLAHRVGVTNGLFAATTSWTQE